MDTKTIRCNECDTLLVDNDPNQVGNTPCPNCGSTKRKYKILIKETIKFHEKLGLKISKIGVKKPIKEIVSGDDLFEKENKYVFKQRIIDRENNKYYEKITDKETGKVIHERDEKLSEHIGRGSAKKQKKKNK